MRSTILTSRGTLSRLALAGFAAALFACQFGTEPKHKTPGISLGMKIEGSLAAGDSVLEYLVASDTTQFRVLFMATSGSKADTLVATLVDETGRRGGTVQSVGTDTSLGRHASEWIKQPPAAAWRLQIRRKAGTDGRFVVQLFRRSSAPEKLGATITVGQVVDGEEIDVSDDVDEFRINATAGDEWVVFAQASYDFTIYVVDAATDSIVGAAAVPYGVPFAGDNLEFWSSGRVVLPKTGTYILRAAAAPPQRYKFRIDKVNRAPEGRPAPIAFGAAVNESIGSVADVDEFTFTGSAGQEVDLAAHRESGLAAGLVAQLVYQSNVIAGIDFGFLVAQADTLTTGRVTLPGTGQYVVRLFGQTRGRVDSTTGSYRFSLYRIDRSSENGGSLTFDGPTVSAALDYPGDVDEFTIQGTAGQLAMLHIEGPVVLGRVILAQLVGSDGKTVYTSTMNGGLENYPLNYSVRAELPYTGTYTIRVSGTSSGSMAEGPYTLEAYTVSSLPEHVPPTLQIGDSVTGERIDRPGDIDVFTLAGQAGREVNVFLGWPPTNGALWAHLDGSPLYLFTYAVSTSLDSRGIGRLMLENKTYTWVVDSHWITQSTSSQGAYAFRVFPIDRKPEGRAAAYVLGDTVSGEPVYPSGDVDEYTFQLNAPATLHAFWDADPLVRGLLFNESTGEIVWGPESTYNDIPVRDFSLPAGSYRFELRGPLDDAGVDPLGFKQATLTYRFALCLSGC